MKPTRSQPSLHGWSDKKILSNVSATLQHLYLDQKNERFLNILKLELFKYF